MRKGRLWLRNMKYWGHDGDHNAPVSRREEKKWVRLGLIERSCYSKRKK